ncbi:ferritin heavy polypeptide-like 17 [Cavia porcellus]
MTQYSKAQSHRKSLCSPRLHGLFHDPPPPLSRVSRWISAYFGTMGAPRGPRRLRSRRHRCSVRSQRARANFMAFAAFVLNLPTMLPQGQPSYHPECEAAVINQIHLQLHCSYIYLSMALYCNSVSGALKNYSHFFLRRCHQWQEGAEKLMRMQQDRGGSVVLCNIVKPNISNWHACIQAVEYAFRVENTLKQSLVLLHSLATDKNDSDLSTFLLYHYIKPQVPVLNQLENCLTSLRETETAGDSSVSYLFSKLSLEDTNKEN